MLKMDGRHDPYPVLFLSSVALSFFFLSRLTSHEYFPLEFSSIWSCEKLRNQSQRDDRLAVLRKIGERFEFGIVCKSSANARSAEEQIRAKVRSHQADFPASANFPRLLAFIAGFASVAHCGHLSIKALRRRSENL
jgi:hypothetical protein